MKAGCLEIFSVAGRASGVSQVLKLKGNIQHALLLRGFLFKYSFLFSTHVFKERFSSSDEYI